MPSRSLRKSFTSGLERNQHRLKQEQKEGQKKESRGKKKDIFDLCKIIEAFGELRIIHNKYIVKEANGRY